MTEQKDPLSWEDMKKEYLTSLDANAGLSKAISNKEYASERELRIDLEKFGLDDLRIVLNKQGCPIWREMPGEAHRGAVEVIMIQFDEWKKKWSVLAQE
jgi:hypothetical protein